MVKKFKLFFSKEHYLSKAMFSLIVLSAFILIFSPAIAQFLRYDGPAGYGWGYGYGYGSDSGLFSGWKEDFTDSNKEDYGVGYGFGYMLDEPVSGIYTLTNADLPNLYIAGLISAGADPTATSSVTFNDDVTIEISASAGTISVAIPAGAVLTKTAGGSFDFTAVTSSDQTSSASISGQTIKGALQFGIPDIGLTSDTAVTITIPVGTSLNGQGLTVYKSETSATAGWSSTTTCTVASGNCTFTTTTFSYFASAQAASGGGGVGSSATVITPGVLKINNGATTTGSTSVTLTFNATNASQVAISNTADFLNATWQTYATSKTWTLTTGDGAKTVYAKFKATDGTVSSTISASITLGTSTPAELKAKSDINKDNKVNDYDFSILMANWGSTPTNAAADINGDGKVNDYDFSILMSSWTV